MKRKSLHQGNRFTTQEKLPRGYEDLCNAIVTQAAADYIKALKYRLDKGPESIKQLEKFFRSKWYRDLTDIDGEWLMERLREAVDAGRKTVRHAETAANDVGHHKKAKAPKKGGNCYEKKPLIERMLSGDNRIGGRYV